MICVDEDTPLPHWQAISLCFATRKLILCSNVSWHWNNLCHISLPIWWYVKHHQLLTYSLNKTCHVCLKQPLFQGDVAFITRSWVVTEVHPWEAMMMAQMGMAPGLPGLMMPGLGGGPNNWCRCGCNRSWLSEEFTVSTPRKIKGWNLRIHPIEREHPLPNHSFKILCESSGVYLNLMVHFLSEWLLGVWS